MNSNWRDVAVVRAGFFQNSPVRRQLDSQTRVRCAPDQVTLHGITASSRVYRHWNPQISRPESPFASPWDHHRRWRPGSLPATKTPNILSILPVLSLAMLVGVQPLQGLVDIVSGSMFFTLKNFLT